MTQRVKETFSTVSAPHPTEPAAPPAPAAPTAPAPPHPDALQAKIRALLPTMTRSMHRIAATLAADPAAGSRLTVTGLAELTGTSEATVVRTARVLGYPGYRDLRLALAALAARQDSSVVPEVMAGIALDDPLPDVVAKLAREEQQVLADTALRLDTAQLEAAVAAMCTARRIDVYGIGASALVAQDLAQKLLRIGLISHAHGEMHLAMTSAVQLRSSDLAIGISHSGGTVDVVEPLQTAFGCGATTVAVTSRPESPISQYADHVLATAAGQESELRPAAMSSRTSQLLVVDCLFLGVAQRTYETARRGLAASYEALASRRRSRPAVS
jgi:DNA-binding MurR/RpiR family transcriptional regulator